MPTLSVEQVLSGSELGLNFGLADLLILDVGGRRVLYALSRIEGRLIEINIATDGSLSVDGSLSLAGGFTAGSDPMLGAFSDAGGALSLALAGLPVAARQTVSLAADGSLGTQAALPGVGALTAPIGFSLDGAPILITGRAGGGLDLLSDEGAGFGFAAGMADSADTYLGDVSAGVWFSLGGADFVATASAFEDGLNLVQVTATALIQRDALGAAEGLPINTPVEVGVIQRLGETLLVTGSFDTSSISVVDVGMNGDMRIADHILDAPDTYFQGLNALDVLVRGDFAFVAAGGADGGVSLFTVLPGGRLVHLDSVADDASTSLYRVSSIEMIATGSRLDMLVSSAWESGITRIGYDLSALGAVLVADSLGGVVTGTSGRDQLVGSDMADTLAGGAGDDILADGAGQDVLTGGAGADLFVLTADGLVDVITDYDRTADRLDLSAWDFLYDAAQLSVTPTADGAILGHGTETLVITALDGASLTASDFTTATILNVDRPPLLPIARTLQGGPGPDTLNGGWGNDTIGGAGGDDVLTGSGGDDSILGGSGDDLLDGGAGADTLAGEPGADTLVGGIGDDRLLGGIGNDVIYGDDYDWSGA